MLTQLKTFFQDRGFDSALTGINVHIKVPNGDKFAQADVIFSIESSLKSNFAQRNPKKSADKSVA